MSEFNRRRTSSGLDGLKPAFERLTDGVSSLVKQHIELARHEITRDATTTARRLGILGACALVALMGYTLLLVAAITFAGWLGGMLAAWIVALALGGAHLGLAGGFGAHYARKLRTEKPVDLAQLSDELNKDRLWLQQMAASAQTNDPQAQLSFEPGSSN